MNKRIWELDAFRGLCLLGMLVVHLVFDIVYLYRIIPWQYPAWFSFVQEWGGVLFIVLSGICVTLGRHHLRRGLIVFGCALLVTASTLVVYLLGLSDETILIYFGVLHCLGICMLLWGVFRRCPDWLLLVLGAALTAAGLYLKSKTPVDFPWLIPLGIVPPFFFTSDYFPLMPNLGYFLLGAVLGRHLYAKKQTLFPKVNAHSPIIRFLSLCGRQSLFIYMGHQPIFAGICMLIVYLK